LIRWSFLARLKSCPFESKSLAQTGVLRGRRGWKFVGALGSGVGFGDVGEEGGGGIEVGLELGGLGGAKGLGELSVELLADFDAGGFDGLASARHADALGAGVGGVGDLFQIALALHEADELAHGLLGDAGTLGEDGRTGSSLIE